MKPKPNLIPNGPNENVETQNNNINSVPNQRPNFVKRSIDQEDMKNYIIDDDEILINRIEREEIENLSKRELDIDYDKVEKILSNQDEAETTTVDGNIIIQNETTTLIPLNDNSLNSNEQMIEAENKSNPDLNNLNEDFENDQRANDLNKIVEDELKDENVFNSTEPVEFTTVLNNIETTTQLIEATTSAEEVKNIDLIELSTTTHALTTQIIPEVTEELESKKANDTIDFTETTPENFEKNVDVNNSGASNNYEKFQESKELSTNATKDPSLIDLTSIIDNDSEKTIYESFYELLENSNSKPNNNNNKNKM